MQNGKNNDWAGQPKAGLSNIFFNIQFLDGVPQLSQLKVLSSTKQIIQKANEVLNELMVSDGTEEAKSFRL